MGEIANDERELIAQAWDGDWIIPRAAPELGGTAIAAVSQDEEPHTSPERPIRWD